MATINEISNGSRYVGSPALGGYSDTAIELDVKPIQQLAQYTFLYNKSQYDQRQKDTDQKIAELAALAPYDLMNGIAKDVDEVKKAKLELEQYSREYLSKVPRTPQEKLDQEIEFNTKKRDTLNKINSANQRAIKFVAETNRINNDTALSLDEKALQLEDLKKQLDNTDILTPITSVAKIDIPDITVVAPVMKTAERILLTPNGEVKEEKTFFARNENAANSYAEMLGLMQPPLPANATEEQKRQYKIKEISGNKKYKFLKDMITAYNTAVADPKYSKTVTDPITGEQKSINEVDVEKLNDNPLIHGINNLLEQFNTSQAQKEQDFKDGKYNDYIDPKTKLAINVTEGEFKKIDPTKPLKPEDIFLLEKFRMAAPDKVSKDFKYTGDATKIRLENIQQAGENWRLLHKPVTDKAPPALVDEAKVFTQVLFQKIAAATDANGNVDLAKAQLTPLELQMMGNATITEGKFSLTDPVSADAKLKYDAKTNTITVSDNAFGTSEQDKNINFQQVANNKYNTNSITETGAGENKNRQQLITDYTGAVASTKIDISDSYEVNGKAYTKRQLNALGYSDGQIEEAIKLKTVKVKTKKK